MVENYVLSKEDFEKAKVLSDFQTSAYLLNGLLPARQSEPRRNPMQIPRYVSRNHVIEIKAKDRNVWVPEAIEAAANGIEFSRKATLDGETVRIAYSLTSGGETQVAAADAEAIYKLREKINAESYLSFYLDKSWRLCSCLDHLSVL